MCACIHIYVCVYTPYIYIYIYTPIYPTVVSPTMPMCRDGTLTSKVRPPLDFPHEVESGN